MTTIRDTLQAASVRLAQCSPSPRLDAEVLLAHVLNVGRAYVLAEAQRELTAEQQTHFQTLIERRAALEPIAYITGHKEFYGFDFVVDRRVLVPRPETELVVDTALDWWTHRRPSHAAPLQIADIGTGSGCIAITLALKLPQTAVFAVDLSADALDVARINVQRYGLEQRVTLLHGAGCEPLPQPVTLIVSNPPYTVLEEVDENVRRWEPHLALDGGDRQGFAEIARLLWQMPRYLQPHGAVVLEIGAWQGATALDTARAAFPHARISLHKDLAGLDRVLAIET